MGGGSPNQKTASYVLVAADAGTCIQMNSASSTTITVNTSLFSAGDSVQIHNIGSGTTTITAGTATVNTAGSAAVSQFDGGFLYFTSTSSAIWFDYTQSGLTNPLTTTGDMIYSSGGTTAARLGIGSSGQVLTVASGIPAWATPSSGGMTLLETLTLSGASVTSSSIASGYNYLKVFINNYRPSTDGSLLLRYNSDANTRYAYVYASAFEQTFNSTFIIAGIGGESSVASVNFTAIDIYQYASTSQWKSSFALSYVMSTDNTSAANIYPIYGLYNQTTAITTLNFTTTGTTFTSGTVLIYGVK
jgi:hypothetical protein